MRKKFFLQILFLSFLIFIIFQDLFVYNIGLPIFRNKLLFKLSDELFLLLAICYIFFRIFVKNEIHDIKVPNSFFFYFLFFFIIYTGLTSSIINNVPLFVKLIGGFYLLRPIVLFLVFYFSHFSNNKVFLQSYINIYVYIGFLVFICGIIDFFFYDSYRSITHLSQSPIIQNWGHVFRGKIIRVMSLFDHPTIFGWFSGTVALLGFSFYYNNFRKSIGMILFLVGLIGIVISGTRKTLFGLFFTILFFVFFLSGVSFCKKLKFSFLIILSLSIIVLTFKDQLFLIYSSFLHNLDTQQIARLALYRVAFQIIIDNFPFGVGFGRYGGNISSMFYSPIYDKYNLSLIQGLSQDSPGFISDTYWPHIFGELGLFGGISYLILLILIFFNCVQSYKKEKIYKKDRLILTISLFSILLLVETFIELIASPIIDDPRGSFIIMGFAGIACSRLREK